MPVLATEAPNKMVGRVGVEPTTSRLSGVRSNHLSYRPPEMLLPQAPAPTSVGLATSPGSGPVSGAQSRLRPDGRRRGAPMANFQDEGT